MKLEQLNNHLIKALLGICMLMPLSSYSYVEKDIIVLYQEKRVGDVLFAERIQATDGIKKYTYSINGAPVAYEEYLETLVKTEAQKKKEDYEQEHAVRISLAESYCKARTKIVQQDLNILIQDISKDLKKINENRLKLYWAFSEDTFSSKDELLDLINEILPEAKELAHGSFNIVNYQKLSDYYNKITFYKPRVKSFLAQTINNVVEKSDDTKMLKEILEFII